MPLKDDEKRLQYQSEYYKNQLHKIHLRFPKEIYNNFIKPAIQRSGLPVATFIKEAVEEKIKREKKS